MDSLVALVSSRLPILEFGLMDEEGAKLRTFRKAHVHCPAVDVSKLIMVYRMSATLV